MVVRVDSLGSSAGWLRDTQFDRFFIFGIAAFAIATGLIVVAQPALFIPILVADLWLLGYHHVVSTFTRLCFDAQSFRQNRFLLTGLPLIVFLSVAALTYGVGAWTITTVYLYWQWFHYTRQSWGIAQAYRRKARTVVVDGRWAPQIVFYLPPLWGILYRSHQAPATFLGIELRTIPVSGLLVDIVGIAALAAMVWWVLSHISAWRNRELPVAYTMYQVSHFAVFLVGYVFISNIDVGWLVVNIWHNAQYIAFVWLYNNNRYSSGIDPGARLLSTLSQKRNVWLYLGLCLGISTVSYAAVDSLVTAIVAPVIVFQATNFHHYIVDGLIWKRRRSAASQNLRIAS